MTDVLIDARRGAGSSLEILYGTVTWKPTLTHSRGTSIVLPAPTTYDLVDGQVVATNVQPTPEPVAGQVEWAYEVTFKDRHGKTFSFLVGVPDSTSQVNFISLPRYFETKPPLFGQGPKGDPGESATVAVGTVTGGTTAQVNNSGTNTGAVLDFVLPQGPQGPKGDGVTILDTTFAALPDTYGNGTTIGSATVGAGWPVTGTAQTDRRSASRVIQTLVSTDGTRAMQRSSNGGAWTEFREFAWNTLATTTANGLMSSADKSKLDGMTPAVNSKAFSAQPSAYPVGFHTIQVDTTGEWPVATSAQVVTFKTSTGDANTTQWIYPVEGIAPQFRVADATGVWGDLQEMATRSYVDSKATGVNAKAFGAVGDGVALDSPAIYAAFEAATTLGLPLDIPKGTYRMNGFLSITQDNTEIRMSPGCVLDYSGSGASYAITSVGKMEAKVSTTPKIKGSVTYSLPSHTLLPGDWIRISSDDVFDPYSTNIQLAEIIQVQSVTAGTVTFVSPLRDTYSTNVKYSKMVPVKNIKISGGVLRGNFIPNADKGGILLSRVVDSVVEFTRTEGFARVHLSIKDSSNCWAIDTKHHWSLHNNQAYGISFGDCTRNSGAVRANVSNVRHALSTNNSTVDGGIVRDILFRDSTMYYSSVAMGGSMGGGDALDTHTAAENIQIIGNTVLGSSGQGINFECVSGIIQGNVVRNSTGTGISVHNESARKGTIQVVNNTVEFAGISGMSIRAGVRSPVPVPYESIIVSGNQVSDVTGVGIKVGFATLNLERSVSVTGNTVTRSDGRGMEFTLIDSLTESNNVIVDCLGGGILYDRVIYGSLGPDSIRQIRNTEGTPYIAIDCVSVTRSSLRPGAVRVAGDGNRGVRIASSCADMSVLGTSHIFAGVKVENLGGSTVIVSN